MWDATFSLVTRPPLPLDREPDCVGVSTRGEGGGPNPKLKGEEAGRFREVAGMSIVAAGGPCLR